MATPNNILQNVITAQESGLALMLNNCAVINASNKKFKDFEKIDANLGDSVDMFLPPQVQSVRGLTAVLQPAVQRTARLTVNRSYSSAMEFSAVQRMFNVEKMDEYHYVDTFGKGIIADLGSRIEKDTMLEAVSATTADGSSVKNADSGPYRFYGDGSTAINSYEQLSNMITRFVNPGMPRNGIKVIIPDLAKDAIIGSGLTEFATNRNNKDANSWEIGNFGTPPVTYMTSQFCPLHTAGTIGNTAAPGNQLTVVSVDDPTGTTVTSITFSGATGGADAIKAGDLLEFADGVSGFTNLRLMSKYGDAVSASPVQFRAAADATESGGNVTVSIKPTLSWNSAQNIRVNTPIIAGMKANVMPSHRAGLVWAGDAFYMAMPRLPNLDPFNTYNEYDENSGMSLQCAVGADITTAENMYVHRAIVGSLLVPEYSMRICFPTTV